MAGPAYTMLTSRQAGQLSVGYRILYLYKKKNTYYREKREGNLSFFEKIPGDGEELLPKVFYCGVPEYYGVRTGRHARRENRLFSRIRKSPRAPEGEEEAKKRYVPWNFGQLLRLLQNCCVYVSADACYLEEDFERELAASNAGFLPGRQRMCAELIGRLSGQFRGIDSILYLWGKGEEREKELPLSGELLRKLCYFFYMGEKEGQFAALEENLWEGYGMPILAVGRPEELAACRIKRLLVLDDRPEGDADWAVLPKGCVYLDLWSVPGRREQITRKRADIKYVSEYLYLCRNFDITSGV